MLTPAKSGWTGPCLATKGILSCGSALCYLDWITDGLICLPKGSLDTQVEGVLTVVFFFALREKGLCRVQI